MLKIILKNRMSMLHKSINLANNHYPLSKAELKINYLITKGFHFVKRTRFSLLLCKIGTPP